MAGVASDAAEAPPVCAVVVGERRGMSERADIERTRRLFVRHEE